MSDENKIATIRSLHASTALATGEAYRAELGRWQGLIRSGALPNHITSPERALAIARHGEAYGWDAFRSLNAIYIVDGRPCLSAESMLGLVREKLPQAKILPGKCDATGATIRAKRDPDDPWSEFSFTIEDAKRAGLLKKSNWQNYPGAMCWARAASITCRRLFSDVIQGAYTTEEAWDASWSERHTIRTDDVLPAAIVGDIDQRPLIEPEDISDPEPPEPGSLAEQMTLDPPSDCPLCGATDNRHRPDCPDRLPDDPGGA